MNEALRFFRDYEAVIYFVLGLGGIVYLVRFWSAWQEMRRAVFGLERESAQRRLNAAAIGLFMLLVMGIGVFLVATFAAPSLPAAVLMPTPTLDLLGEATPNLTPDLTQAAANEQLATATPLPTVDVDTGGCEPGAIEFISPEADAEISGEVQVTGSVDIENFGFYKFEVAKAEEELWLTIQAGRAIVQEGTLVEGWDTSRLPPGDYVLQLVVTNSAGVEQTPCRIPVHIVPPTEEE